MIAHFILYVRDQQESARFYSSVLALAAVVDVPGMTEFQLREGCILGLMPERGIKRLLGDAIVDPAKADGAPRAELYLRVGDPDAYLKRALAHGARELSPLSPRDWGDCVGYCADPDGHVIAFATPLGR